MSLSMNRATLIRQLPRLILLLSFLFLCLSIYFVYVAWQAHAANASLNEKSLLKQKVDPNAAELNYNLGFLQFNQGFTQEALRAFGSAEASDNPAIRARAKYAIGNLYFDLAMRSANIAAGGAHQQAVAQIELAREAYKGALRIEPEFSDAKFNLELLDRLSPEKRTQAWQAETDGVTLKPFKRNGTAMMRDNKRRGLP
jgi:mxaK protein